MDKMETQLGYACINTQLRKSGIFTSRTMVKKTFNTKGIQYASELALQNAKDLVEIIKWNHANGIKLFRMSSGIFPWMSEYEISDLPDYTKISNVLKGAGTLAKSYNQRLSFHPGPFVVLASPSPSVVDNSIKELNQHAETMDLMGLPQSNYAKMNIHVGGAYGDKIAAMARFCKSFKRLTPSAQSRLTIENDDRASMYSVVDLYHGIHKVIGIPIVFDYHHHQFCTGDLSEKAALHLASTTWPDRIKQCVHYSESKALHENNPKIKPQAHSDYIHDRINSWGLPLDVMVESKAKELSIQDYMTNLEN
jgi:UV DNA damage endonuclease